MNSSDPSLIRGAQFGSLPNLTRQLIEEAFYEQQLIEKLLAAVEQEDRNAVYEVARELKILRQGNCQKVAS